MDKPLVVNHAPNHCPSCFVNILFVLNKTCITNSHLGSEPFITVRQWKLIWLHPYFLTKSYLTLVLEFLCADMPVCVQGKWYSCKSMANMVSKWGREREALGQLLRLHGERSIDESCPGKDEMCICPLLKHGFIFIVWGFATIVSSLLLAQLVPLSNAHHRHMTINTKIILWLNLVSPESSHLPTHVHHWM